MRSICLIAALTLLGMGGLQAQEIRRADAPVNDASNKIMSQDDAVRAKATELKELHGRVSGAIEATDGRMEKASQDQRVAISQEKETLARSLREIEAMLTEVSSASEGNYAEALRRADEMMVRVNGFLQPKSR